MNANQPAARPGGGPVVGPSHLAVIDDEPMITDSVKAHFNKRADAGLPPVMVNGFDRPRRLRDFESLLDLTHAVIDLSFGRDDIDGPQIRPEIETGLDAIDLLKDRCANCKIVVATRNDTELITEMAVAVRQTWPEIKFFHKADSRLRARIEDFVVGNHYQDNAEIALDLIGVTPVAPERIGRAVEATARARPGARLILTLADYPSAPSRRDLAAALGGRAQAYVRSLSSDLTAVLIEWGLLSGDEGGGVSRLWKWARARRAILRRELATIID
ncbi:MAG: hypothetical protein GY939_12505 [Actinomycetia bacterium]|nr:hypothetical protein [Actinomycetes bacterium]